jgi:hypothetical protein
MSSRKEGGQHNYLLIASGPKGYAPYLGGWQEFKDFVRKYVKGQPSWTNVLPGQRRGDVEGWTTMKDKEDAENVYSMCIYCSWTVQPTNLCALDACSRSQGIMVHIFATSKQNSYFNLIKCNCGLHFPDVGARGHSPGRSAMDVGRVNQILGTGFATMPLQYVTAAQPTYQYANYYPTPAYAPTPMYAYPTSTMQYAPAPAPAPVPVPVSVPVYSQSSGGLPVNLGQGAVLTESRGIFIQGLSYSARSSDVASLIHNVGLRPSKITILRDSRGGSKGCASVDFETKTDAQHGVKYLHGISHMNKTLTVRLDTESTVVGVVPPLVVAGAVMADGTNKSSVSIVLPGCRAAPEKCCH